MIGQDEGFASRNGARVLRLGVPNNVNKAMQIQTKMFVGRSTQASAARRRQQRSL